MPKQTKNLQSGNRAARLCRSYVNLGFALLAEIRQEVEPTIRAREMVASGEMPDDGFNNTPISTYVHRGYGGEVIKFAGGLSGFERRNEVRAARGLAPLVLNSNADLPSVHSIGGKDSDDDLSLSNSLLCETPKADFNAKDSAEVQ